MSTHLRLPFRLDDKASRGSHASWSSVQDIQSSMTPLGDRMDIRSPKSGTDSSEEDSDIFVQSQDDDHYSPVSLVPNRPKPGLFAFDISKSDTESNRPQQG